MSTRVCLMLGNGGYATELHENLVDDPRVALIAVLHPSNYRGEDRHIEFDLLEPTALLDRLEEEEITHIILGGDLRLSLPLRAALQTIRDRSFRRMVFGWWQTRTLGGALDAFGQMLVERGIEPVLASDYIPALRPGAGVLAEGAFAVGQEGRHLDSYVAHIARQASDELGRQPVRSVRQACLFEDHQLRHQETAGTDRLLQKWADEPKSGKVRSVVKLCPPGYDHRLDAPVVGKKTIELAASAQVDLIVVEAERGILTRKMETLELCQTLGITLYGLQRL